jgi:outer membrane protein TolC
VEDALVQESAQRATIANLGTQLGLARQAYEGMKQRFFQGQLDYLRVLESLESQQRLERSQLTAQRFLIDRRIDLCRALAGAWDMDRPEIARLAQ